MKLAISPDYPFYNSALRNIQLLENERYITPAFAQLLNELQAVRNKAAHASAAKDSDDKSVPYVNAINYWHIADEAARLLSSLSR